MAIIDPSVPPQKFWSENVGGNEICPKCGHGLINEQQIYVMVVRQAGRIEPFIAGTKAGFLCPESSFWYWTAKVSQISRASAWGTLTRDSTPSSVWWTWPQYPPKSATCP